MYLIPLHFSTRYYTKSLTGKNRQWNTSIQRILRLFPWHASPPCNWKLVLHSNFPVIGTVRPSSVSSSKSAGLYSIFSSPGDALWAAYLGGQKSRMFSTTTHAFVRPSVSACFVLPEIFHSPLIHELCRELNTCALNCRPCASFGSLWIVGGKVHPVPCIDPLLALLSRRRRRIVFRARIKRTGSSWNFLRLNFSFRSRVSWFEILVFNF